MGCSTWRAVPTASSSATSPRRRPAACGRASTCWSPLIAWRRAASRRLAGTWSTCRRSRFGIALGSFRDQDLANRHLADLQKRGVKAARVADKPSTVSATRFVIRGVDPVLATALQDLQKEFNAARLVVCSAPT